MSKKTLAIYEGMDETKFIEIPSDVGHCSGIFINATDSIHEEELVNALYSQDGEGDPKYTVLTFKEFVEKIETKEYTVIHIGWL